MNKLAQKITTFIIAFAALIVVALPVYANDVTIDYAKEEIKGLTTDYEFSFNNTTWAPIYDNNDGVDLSTIISPSKDITFYYRKDDGTGDTNTMEIPSRPSAPFVTFVPGEDVSDDKISTSSVHEVKLGNSLWVTSPTEGVNVKTASPNGATFLVRIAATPTSFASATGKVVVPKQSVKPSLPKYDYKKDAVVVSKGMEYQVGPARTAAEIKDDKIETIKEKWVAVGSTEKQISRETIQKALGNENGADASTVYVRTKSTATKSTSNIAVVDLPAGVAAPTNIKIDLTDEKLTGLSAKVEYRILTEKSAASATAATPVWKSVNTSSLSLSKVFSASSSKTPNTIIQVRLKATAAAGSVVAKPASTPFNINIAKRPATPKATDVTMNFTADSETMSIPATLEYKYATDTAWTNGADSIAIASKIPAAGKAVAVNVRVKAVESTDSETPNVPASAISTATKIPAHPAAPKVTFNAKAKKVTGVTSKMEYALGSSSDFTPVVGTFIDLSDQGAGSNVTVKVRLISTAKAPVSAVRTVTGTMPADKN